MKHLAHYADGYPLCWPQDREGDHDSTRAYDDVTCVDCNQILNDAEAS